MPKKFLMSWQKDKLRWRKMFKGKWFFVTPKELGCISTKEASWTAANQWWERTLAVQTIAKDSIQMMEELVMSRKQEKINYRNVIEFPNGFGVSIVCHEFSYGGKKNLFEIALLKNDDIVYHKNFSDVRGWLDFQQVAETIEEVKNYPPDLEVSLKPIVN